MLQAKQCSGHFHKLKPTQSLNVIAKTGPKSLGLTQEEQVHLSGKTGPDRSSHTETLMSYPHSASFNGISWGCRAILFLAFSTKHSAEFRS